MLWRRPESRVIPLCSANGISQVVWSPLAQGTLTGKYKPGAPPPADSRAASNSMGSMMGRFRDDDVLAAAMGEDMIDTYLRLKRSEAAAYAGMDPDTIANHASVIDRRVVPDGAAVPEPVLFSYDGVMPRFEVVADVDGGVNHRASAEPA